MIQLKLEGQLIARHPEWGMAERDIFGQVDFGKGTVVIGGREHKLLDTSFPTVDPADPLRLSPEEEELMNVLTNSFMHSEKLAAHIRFLYSKGSMYKCINGNLLFHGCIPMNEDGSWKQVTIGGEQYSGKALLDRLDELAGQAYFLHSGAEKTYASDYMWYLWCGSGSPLYGKDKMAFFERCYLDDSELHRENYNSYYRFSEDAEVCGRILEMFGLDPQRGHIINGHVPVRIKNGESPVKAGGRLFVIDGGISKAYQSTTGIAGYTLIYDSHSLNLAEHKPFIAGESEHTPTIHCVEKLEHRANISDTDNGRELLEKINDLRELLAAYRSGLIRER